MSYRLKIARIFNFVVPQFRTRVVVLQNAHNKDVFYNERKSFSSRIVDSNKAIAPQTTDLLMQNLRLATHTSDVLYNVNQHHGIMNDSHVMQAMQSIFVLQKSQQSSMSKEEIVKSGSFNMLCKMLHQRVRFFELNDQFNVLKVMSLIGVSTNAKIVQILLQLIVKQINDLSLQQIVFLDFILKDFESCPLVDALKIALPVVFEAHFRLQRDGCDTKQLSELFTYAIKRKLSDRCVDAFVETLIENSDTIELDVAKHIVRTLCELKSNDPQHVMLLHKILDNVIDNIDRVSFMDLNYILARLTSPYNKRNSNHFYHEEFLNTSAKYVISRQCPNDQATWILKSCNRFTHMHKDLLDYICNNVAENPSQLDEWGYGMIITLVNGLALANYRPEAFSVFEGKILDRVVKALSGKLELPWVRIALDLCTLDCWPHELFNIIFEENVLNSFLKRNNFEDACELLLLYQSVTTLCLSYGGNLPSADLMDRVIKKVRQFDDSKVSSPLLPVLVHGLGGPSYVHSPAYTKLGHFIDHVVVMRKGGYFVSINNNVEHSSKVPVILEDIVLPEDGQILLVLYLTPQNYTINTQRILGQVQLSINTLEAMGYSVIPVVQGVWDNLLESEKIPYLMQALQNKSQARESIKI